MTIDIDRCIKAMKDLEIRGTPRNDLIEEAIKLIQDGSDYLDSKYLGIKNYAGFGDQREDHQYGYGPKHGTIVFEIGKTYHARSNNIKLGEDHIYLLECHRDFKPIADPFDLSDYDRKPKLKSLSFFLSSFIRTKEQFEFYSQILENTTVESMLNV